MSWFRSFWETLRGPPAGPSRGSRGALRNFTPRAQQVLALAMREAERLNCHFVGTEHLLLGVVELGQGIAVAVFQGMGLDLDTVRGEVEKWVGPGHDRKGPGWIPYTPRVERVLDLAAKEAQGLGHTYVGADHILLGLLREGDGSAARVLKRLGIDAKDCRQQILRELDPNGPAAGPERKGSEKGQGAAVPRVPVDTVDTSKRYDVYCREGGRELVVYRNVLFKGRRWLLSTPKRDPYAEFLELALSNGQTVYLSPLAIGKFCEHGGETDAEEES